MPSMVTMSGPALPLVKKGTNTVVGVTLEAVAKPDSTPARVVGVPNPVSTVVVPVAISSTTLAVVVDRFCARPATGVVLTPVTTVVETLVIGALTETGTPVTPVTTSKLFAVTPVTTEVSDGVTALTTDVLSVSSEAPDSTDPVVVESEALPTTFT